MKIQNHSYMWYNLNTVCANFIVMAYNLRIYILQM